MNIAVKIVLGGLFTAYVGSLVVYSANSKNVEDYILTSLADKTSDLSTVKFDYDYRVIDNRSTWVDLDWKCVGVNYQDRNGIYVGDRPYALVMVPSNLPFVEDVASSVVVHDYIQDLSEVERMRDVTVDQLGVEAVSADTDGLIVKLTKQIADFNFCVRN